MKIFAGLMSRWMMPLACAAFALGRWARAAHPYRQPLAQRLAFQQFHDDERLAVVFVNVVDGADVRMVKRRGCASLAPEAFERRGVVL